MDTICFVQSEFQTKISITILPHGRVISVRRTNLAYVFDTILSIGCFCIAAFQKKRIVIFDHRNPLIFLGVFFTLFNPRLLDRIFIGDDGLHSVLVDNRGAEFLYWNCNPLKRILLKFCQSRILKFKRLQSLSPHGASEAREKKFISYFDKTEKCVSSVVNTNLYIDQPLILEAMSEEKRQDFFRTIKQSADILVVQHPRREDISMFLEQNLTVMKMDNLESELKTRASELTIHGFCSTSLLGAKHWNARVILHDIPIELGEPLAGYCRACQQIINNYFLCK